MKTFAIVAALAASLFVAMPAVAAETAVVAPIPAPYPGFMLENGTILRIGPGVIVDRATGAVTVDCSVDAAGINLIVDGVGTKVPVACADDRG